MIIVLEGLDCVGKDTVLDRLKKELKDILICDIERPKDNSEKERRRIKDDYKRELHNAIINLPKTTIFNRCWVSEQVYSIKRGYDALWDSEIMQLSEKLRKHPHIFFYFYNDNDEEVKRRMEVRGEDYLKFEERNNMNERYNQALSYAMLSVKNINTDKSKEEVYKEVLEIIKDKK